MGLLGLLLELGILGVHCGVLLGHVHGKVSEGVLEAAKDSS